MASVDAVVRNYQILIQEWNKKPVNLDICGNLLENLKVSLTTLSFLPMTGAAASKQELLIARDVLEIGAQWAVAKKDIPVFERYMAQLKCYYYDYGADLPESAFKYQLLGLNLLCLLAQNKLAEFHTEVELLPPKEIYSNVYIKHPISLEQYLMEGSYNKVFLARGNVPAESYSYFMDTLLRTIRDEIAACMDKAYNKMAVNEAARMLFDTVQPTLTYAKERNWQVSSDQYFTFNKEETVAEDTVPSLDLAAKTIEYAKELEMIV